MPELAEVETPKNAGFVNRGVNYETRRKRLEEEEEELRKLESGESVEEEATEEEEADTEIKEEALSPEERSFKKRYGDLRRHLQQKEKDWEEKFQSLESRFAREGIVPPKSDEDIEQWAKQYPDVAGIVETIAAKKAQEMFNKADARLREIDEVQYEAQRMKAESEIQKAHSDFIDLRNSDEFHDWADSQPKWVRDALYENSDDPASVIRVIDLYKSDKGMTKDARKEKNRAAASVVSKSNKAQVSTDESEGYIRESQVAKMSDREFENRADEINEAIRSGKFVYDISGSAR
jgi:hypothetical protein